MKKPILFTFIILLLQLSATAQYCTDDDRFTQTPVFTDQQIAYDTGVVYGNALNYQGINQDLLLNICYPNASVDTFTRRPLIILMHGGGFLVGNRNDLNTMCIEFSKRGFVAATIGYRLGWDTGIGGCDGDTLSNAKAVYRGWQDAHAALRFLVANAALYKIDTSWIFSGGESAGGVTTLNLAFTSQSEMNARLPELQADLGNVDQSGNALTTTFSLKGIFNNWGSIVETGFITADDALPMIAFHGDQDQCLPIDSGTYNLCPNYIELFGSRSIYNTLQSLGVCAEINVKTNGDHGIYDETYASDVYRVGKAACFFKSIFCSTCSSAYINDSTATDCATTGIFQNESSDGIRIFPNPNVGKITIAMEWESSSIRNIDVYNMFGECVFSDSRTGIQNTFEIDLSAFPKGMYLIRIQDGKLNYTKKLVIQ